jgi:hypothetical protein
MTNMNEKAIINIENENGADCTWIDRQDLTTGKVTVNCVYAPAWSDAEAITKAAKVIARLSF